MTAKIRKLSILQQRVKRTGRLSEFRTLNQSTLIGPRSRRKPESSDIGRTDGKSNVSSHKMLGSVAFLSLLAAMLSRFYLPSTPFYCYHSRAIFQYAGPSCRPLNVAVVGAGIGGLSAAISLRRQGHQVTVYERYDFTGGVGFGHDAKWHQIAASVGLGCQSSQAGRYSDPGSGRTFDREQVSFEQFIVRNRSTGEKEAVSPWDDYRSSLEW